MTGDQLRAKDKVCLEMVLRVPYTVPRGEYDTGDGLLTDEQIAAIDTDNLKTNMVAWQDFIEMAGDPLVARARPKPEMDALARAKHDVVRAALAYVFAEWQGYSMADAMEACVQANAVLNDALRSYAEMADV